MEMFSKAFPQISPTKEEQNSEDLSASVMFNMSQKLSFCKPCVGATRPSYLSSVVAVPWWHSLSHIWQLAACSSMNIDDELPALHLSDDCCDSQQKEAGSTHK